MITIQLRIRRVEQVWQPKAWLDVNNSLSFASPSFGPNSYVTVGKQILEKGLVFPTGDDTADLLYSAYCSEAKDELEFQDVRNIMKNRWLWVGNRKLWTSEGVYTVQDQTAIGKTQNLDINELEKALRNGKEFSWGGVRVSADKRVRFAPKGSYILGDHSSESLAKDGDVIASYNPEGAEKLGEVSKTFSYNPKTWGLDIQAGQEPEQRVSAVGGYCGGRLSLIGDDFGDDDYSRAFGVSPKEKAK